MKSLGGMLPKFRRLMQLLRGGCGEGVGKFGGDLEVWGRFWGKGIRWEIGRGGVIGEGTESFGGEGGENARCVWGNND